MIQQPFNEKTPEQEVAPTVAGFRTDNRWCSWLGLCPGNRLGGGKVLSSPTRRIPNRASGALREAGVTSEWSQLVLGGFFRRMKRRLGLDEAITAIAHEGVRIICRLIEHAAG